MNNNNNDNDNRKGLHIIMASTKRTKIKITTNKGINQMSYSPQIIETISYAISRGALVKDACILAGINQITHNEWLIIHPEYEVAINKANAKFISTLAEVLINEALINPKYALKVLQARSKAEWGTSVIELTGGDKPLVIANCDLDKLDKKTIDRIAELIANTGY